MLMNRLRDTYREITGYIEPAGPITTIPSHHPAANAGNIAKTDMRARRARRQRRIGQDGLRNVSGWSVTSW